MDEFTLDGLGQLLQPNRVQLPFDQWCYIRRVSGLEIKKLSEVEEKGDIELMIGFQIAIFLGNEDNSLKYDYNDPEVVRKLGKTPPILSNKIIEEGSSYNELDEDHEGN